MMLPNIVQVFLVLVFHKVLDYLLGFHNQPITHPRLKLSLGQTQNHLLVIEIFYKFLHGQHHL